MERKMGFDVKNFLQIMVLFQGVRSPTIRLNWMLFPPLHLSWAAPEKQDKNIHETKKKEEVEVFVCLL